MQCEMRVCYYAFGRGVFEDSGSEWERTLDHKVPKADGGSNGLENKRPSHKLCNRMDYSLRIGRSHRRDDARIDEARARWEERGQPA
jgi:hypothetical protein